MSDLISELPECLIVRILSKLRFEEAVRTSSLSTRWKNHWKNIDRVVVFEEYDTLSQQQQRHHFSILAHIVMQCLCAKTIVLHTRSLYVPVRDVLNTLLQWVVQTKVVESLTLQFCQFNYGPPEWFYRNSTLVKLNVSHWKFNTVTTQSGVLVSWTRLRSLTMDHVSIGDGQMFTKILSGCPVLETLDLFDVNFFNTLNVTSPCLLKLSVVYDGDVDGPMEINAPRLQFLNLSGNFFADDLNLVNVSSLVNASLKFDSDGDGFNNPAYQVLECVHDRVQELTVGYEFIPAASLLKVSGSGKPCPLFNCCKRLTFIISMYKHELLGITYLLQSCSHNLETLVIEVRKYARNSHHDTIYDMCDFEAANYLMSMEFGDFPHLKSIKVTYCCCEEITDTSKKNEEYYDFELVSCILRKAHVLEKLVIEPQEEFCECSRDCSRERASMLSHELLQFFMNREQVCEWRLRKKSYLEIIV